MMDTSQFMLQSEIEHWQKYPDFKCQSKKVGRYRVELIGGTDRGAQINIWEPGYESLEHVWPPSDDKKYHKADTVCFWYYNNAVEEYRQLKTVRDVLNLMRRNL